MDRDPLSAPLKGIGVIIVTHDSEASIDQTLFALRQQTLAPLQVILIDSGSSDLGYLKHHDREGTLELCFMPNIGFAAANNLGYSSLEESLDYILFLNPDVILPKDFLEKALAWMQTAGREKVGAITGPLLGWDLEKEAPTGLIDSTGIFETGYGRFYDRAQGYQARHNPFQQLERLPAICGALMFCRKGALESVKLPHFQIFDEDFFCYKEDIDLSYRLRKKGWTLCYVPEFVAYHARGWKTKRSDMERSVRLMSAKNELKLHLKGYNPIKIIYSALKYFGVVIFDI